MSSNDAEPPAAQPGSDEALSNQIAQPSSVVVTSEGGNQNKKRKASVLAAESISTIVADSGDDESESSEEQPAKRTRHAKKIGSGYKRKGFRYVLPTAISPTYPSLYICILTFILPSRDDGANST